MYSELYQILRKYCLPGHREIRRYLKELERTQWLTRDELEEMQLKKIQRLISYAYEHVPFYRERYQREGIHPQDIKSLKDFQALPLLTRDDINNNRNTIVPNDLNIPSFEGATSGSTGRQLRFIMDKSAGLWSYAAETRCRSWYGIFPGDKMARFLVQLSHGATWPWKDKILNQFKRYRFLDPRTATEAAMRAFAVELAKWHPTMFRVYPSSLLLFTDYLKKHNIQGIKTRFIESTGEKISSSQRQLFEEIYQAQIADHYSSLEIFSIAYQCPEGSLHVLEDRYLELVNDNGMAKPGQIGDIVITSLNQYAMPFIRYVNGDMGIFEPGNCTCGRGMPVLREVVARKSDVLVNSEGQAIHWTSPYVVMMFKPEVYQYQIYQPDKLHLEVSLVCQPGLKPAFFEDVRNELQPYFGDTMNISVGQVDHIELTPAGKHRFIISEVKPDFI